MRKTIYILAACLCLASCNGYLNVKPQGKVLPQTDEEFASIMHNRICDIEGGYDEFVIGNMDVIARREGCADDLDANLVIGRLDSYAGEVINHRQTDYKEIFEIIRDCNIVIENMEGRTTTLASDVLAAAYAMKGICYYNLIRDFCDAPDAANIEEQLGMPLVDKFDIMDMSTRASLAQTVGYAEGLLNKSLSKKMSDGKFYFTEYVVKAYLARLAFWTEDWDKTITLCNDIIENSGLALTDIAGYEDMIQSQYLPKGEVIVRSHINIMPGLCIFTSLQHNGLLSCHSKDQCCKHSCRAKSNDHRTLGQRRDLLGRLIIRNWCNGGTLASAVAQNLLFITLYSHIDGVNDLDVRFFSGIHTASKNLHCPDLRIGYPQKLGCLKP